MRGNELEMRAAAAIWAAPCGWVPILATRSRLPARGIYGQEEISERHRHRYEVTSITARRWSKRACAFSGLSPDGQLPEIVEIPRPSLVHRRSSSTRN